MEIIAEEETICVRYGRRALFKPFGPLRQPIQKLEKFDDQEGQYEIFRRHPYGI